MSQNFNEVLETAQQSWIDIEGVMTITQGKKEQENCIDVYITGNNSTIKEQIPPKYKGYPVVFRESGGPFKPE
jgi:hypothetical protein